MESSDTHPTNDLADSMGFKLAFKLARDLVTFSSAMFIWMDTGLLHQ
jgi:hypothetical protein